MIIVSKEAKLRCLNGFKHIIVIQLNKVLDGEQGTRIILAVQVQILIIFDEHINVSILLFQFKFTFANIKLALPFIFIKTP